MLSQDKSDDFFFFLGWRDSSWVKMPTLKRDAQGSISCTIYGPRAFLGVILIKSSQ